MRLAFVLTFAVLAAGVRADTPWSVTTADFTRSPWMVASMDDQKLTGTQRDTPTTLPMDRVLRLDRAGKETPSAAHFIVVTANGDKIFGEVGALKDEVLSWESPVLGTVHLPLENLRAIAHAPTPPANVDEERKEDQLTLSNHDVVRGVVSGIDDGKVLMQVNGDASPIPLTSVESIFFASPAEKSAGAERVFRLRLIDGSQFTTRTVQLSGNKIAVKLPDNTMRDLDQANVISLEQLNGPVRWLSDLATTVSEQTPFNSETPFPAKFDRNVFGRPLRVGTQTFEKGIGVHANSRLVFPLDGTFKTFRTRFGVDTASESNQAFVNIRVLLDDKVAHEERGLRAYTATALLSLDVSQAKTLTLEVTAAGPTDTQDRFDWIEAALVREKAPATAPTGD